MNSMSVEMTKMGHEVNKVLPGVNRAVGKDMPHAAVRAVEALNEATVLLKAMQRNFFVRGSVSEVREEEKSRRTPSSFKKPSSNPVNACEDVE
jgi:phospholipid/cholesterol/gamma-HCH transport system substrate-binding protein